MIRVHAQATIFQLLWDMWMVYCKGFVYVRVYVCGHSFVVMENMASHVSGRLDILRERGKRMPFYLHRREKATRPSRLQKPRLFLYISDTLQCHQFLPQLHSVLTRFSILLFKSTRCQCHPAVIVKDGRLLRYMLPYPS